MAENQSGSRNERPILWTKIFSTFKIALDAKKLILAGTGILTTAVGWWLLALAFYSPRNLPEWKQYGAEDEVTWRSFRADLASWNLIHELAAPPDAILLETVADIARQPKELDYLQQIDERVKRQKDPIEVQKKEQDWELIVEKSKGFKITPLVDASALEKLGRVTLKDIANPKGDDFLIGVLPVKVEGNADDLRRILQESSPDRLLEEFTRETDAAKRETALSAWELYKNWTPHVKAAGRLRTWPWFEQRGPNPYLMVSGAVRQIHTGKEHEPHGPAHYLSYFVFQLMPVLMEPIFKLLTPVTYLFDPRAGKYEYLYLSLVILYSLAIWGFFGGAITRLAAVQFARNDRLSLKEAIAFSRQRFLSFFSAPVFPLAGMAFLTLGLIIFGLLELIPVFGDILIAGLFWPIALLIGLIMAVILVGLVGLPLMHATISTEGSDSFDALSRSYSYVYGAPWQYLWYSFVSTVYGAAVVFFVIFMGSLLVYAAKWGVGHTPGMTKFEREPSYLFVYAPTSFGWRDLLIHDNPQVAQRVVAANTQRELPYRYEVRSDYVNDPNKFTWYNRIGAVMVAIWIYLFFLLMIGFSYSFFWSAATIIYFLMRRQVDDTDLDEVHLDADGQDEFPRSGPTSSPPASKPNTISLTTIEAPASRPSAETPASPPPPRPETHGG